MQVVKASITFGLLFCISHIPCLHCASYFSTPVPMRAVHHQDSRVAGHDTLMVFLPGNRSDPDDFQKEGFVSILQNAYPDIDSLAVDATLGYYIKESLPERLLEDVIQPAYEKGYKKIWITGISMGGSGALWYAQKYPATIKGIVLLAPFLADKKIIDEIDTAGGLKKWQPALPLEQKDYQRAQMLWLKQYIDPALKPPLIFLGFGDTDRFHQSNRLLADIIPANQVVVLPGNHDWKTWRKIFIEFMRRKILNQ
jgi:pimeloyl-ACP methyl ester carboxylesterase